MVVFLHKEADSITVCGGPIQTLTSSLFYHARPVFFIQSELLFSGVNPSSTHSITLMHKTKIVYILAMSINITGLLHKLYIFKTFLIRFNLVQIYHSFAHFRCPAFHGAGWQNVLVCGFCFCQIIIFSWSFV